jgi:predicted transcriptional regulator
MSRKPVHIESTGPRNDRQAIWEAVRRHPDASFTVNCIRGWLKGSTRRDKIRTYLNALVNGGFLVLEKSPSGRQNRYRLIRDTGVEAPRVRANGQRVRQGETQQRIWKSLKILKGWNSLNAIVAQITTDHRRVPTSTVKSYLKHLEKAGYILIKGKGTQAEYCLIPARYSGPRAPMVQRTKQIYDPNTGEVAWRQEVPHV